MDTPSKELESFITGQINQRRQRIVTLDQERVEWLTRLSAIDAEKAELTTQIDNWMRWLGILNV